MNQQLSEKLAAIRRRLLALGAARGIGWGLLACVVLLVGWMWIDLMFDLAGGVRAAAAWASVLAGVALVGWAGSVALRQGRADAVARRLDEVAGSRGQIRTGVDLARGPATSDVSGGLAQMAVARAGQLVAAIEPGRAVPATVLKRPWGAAGMAMLATGIVAMSAPRMAGALWARFTDPFGDHPPYSRLQLKVEPGNARVVYGQGFDVTVSAGTEGEVIEKAEVVVGDGPGDVLPMFDEGGGKWRATLANVTAQTTYHVRATGARSQRFKVAVVTVPRIEAVRVRVTPPAYTNRPPFEGAIPQDGISGLAGTTVELFAKSNRPLSGGVIDVEGGAAVVMTAGGSHEAAGKLALAKAGKLTLRVTDTDGQSSTDAIGIPVTLLTDERPFVRLVQPMANSYATPSSVLPMEVIAEDDYGVSRVQLFRSLNDSRALPMELAVPQPPPVRFPGGTKVELSKLGLKPGDTIKVFARVEDNDPAGAKGSESTVAVVRIISDADLKRMVLAREGMEVLQSKYAEARRRLEGAAEELKKLQEELAKKEAAGEVDEALKKRIEELAERMAKDAEAVRKAAKDDLPFDIDRKLAGDLEKLAEELEKAAKEAEAAGKKPGQTVGGLAGKLGELAKRLGGAGEKFDKDVTIPLDHLARVFPLIEAQARFVVIYERQRDLADRAASLKDKAKAVDPKDKARMRDMEEEELALRQDLMELLGDIERAALGISEEEYAELQKTAQEFVQKVRESGANEAMSEAQERLADFDGTGGHAKAKEAADILEQFISRAKGMGDGALGKLVFQPGLADGLGNTIDQLLGAEGLSRGGGGGGGGGQTARRSTLRNVGMYGELARAARESRGGGGRSDKGVAGDGRGGMTDRGNPGDIGVGGKGTSTGESDATVPAAYKRRVGDYFRRVADEIGTK